MRTIILITSIFISMLVNAQKNGIQTATLSVKGNCEECKSRIENAADIKGVKLALWDEKTKVLTVTFQSDKVTIQQIEAAIAGSGHDAGATKGNDTKYNKLPTCCKYRDKKCEK